MFLKLFILSFTWISAKPVWAINPPCGHNQFSKDVKSLVKPVMLFSNVDTRMELSDVMKTTKHFTAAEAQQLKKTVGTIFCPAGNGFEAKIGTAFVMGKSDEIFTSGHLVANDEGGRRDVSTCQFVNFANPREAIMIDGSSKRTKLPDWGPSVGDGRYDRARLVLKTPIKGALPLKPDFESGKLSGGEQVFIASGTNRGFKSSMKDPIISTCTARDLDYPGDGVGRLRTDCPLSKGGSGAPLIYKKNGQLVVKGMAINLVNDKLPDGTPYDRQTNYQNNLLFEDDFLTWVDQPKKRAK